MNQEYKLIISIYSEDEKGPKNIEINIGTKEEVIQWFKSTYIDKFDGFQSWDNFFIKLEPKDIIFTEFRAYTQGGNHRKTIDSDSFRYEGETNSKGEKHGLGECLYRENIYTNTNGGIKAIGKFENDCFLEGKILEYIERWEGPYNEYFGSAYKTYEFTGNKINYQNGDIYEGTFKNFKKDGKGVLKKANGEIIEGIWEEDILIKKTEKVDEELIDGGEIDAILKDIGLTFQQAIAMNLIKGSSNVDNEKQELVKKKNEELQPKKQIDPKDEEKDNKDYSILEKKGVPDYLIRDLKAGLISYIWKAKAIMYYEYKPNKREGLHQSQITFFIPSEGKMTRPSAIIWIKTQREKSPQGNKSCMDDSYLYNLKKVELIEFFELEY